MWAIPLWRAMLKHANSKSFLIDKRVAALIPAAGSGVRMGGRVAKPFLQLNGREILAHTLDVFERTALVDDVWVIVGAGNLVACRQGIVERYGFKKVRDVVAEARAARNPSGAGCSELMPGLIWWWFTMAFARS